MHSRKRSCKTMNKPERHSPAPGEIHPDVIYRVDEFKSRMGWRNAAFRSACRQGLKTHRVGKRVYVTGADAIAFVTRPRGEQ
jgi:hypothetical protein